MSLKMAKSTWKAALIKLLENNRGIATFFCLPASFVFSCLLQVRKYAYIKPFRSPCNHDKRVTKIQNLVQQWNRLPKESRKPMCTARLNWMSLSTRFFKKDTCHQIPIRLFDILEVDEKSLTVRVEPRVTAGDIVRHLFPKGYSPAVNWEMPQATLGGLALASAMTTDAHKIGLYHENIVSYEVVLADGSLMTASKEQNADLYNTLMWSHGTLAFVVALTLKIRKIKPYMRITYIPVEGQEEYCKMVRKLSGADSKDDPVPDHIEMTIFSKDKAVIITGEYSDYDSAFSVNHVAKWYKPWFYKYVESFSSEQRTHTELVPLQQYSAKHNRSVYWIMESMLPFGNNLLFRLLFGWLMPPTPAFLKFITTQAIREYAAVRQIFQDILLPISELEKQIDICEELFDLYPLLVYPCRIYDHGLHATNLPQPDKKHLVKDTNYAMYNDLGIYGIPGFVKRNVKYNLVDAMRKMEGFTRNNRGFSMLYPDTFMTREEFGQMFDLHLYEEVRKKYGAQAAFPHLYDKVKPEIDIIKLGHALETQ